MASLEIPYNTPLHSTVFDAVYDRIKISREKMSARYDHYNKMEDEYVAYIPETENDKIRRMLREQKGIPTYTTVNIPYSYAVLMAAHMYFCSVFLGRSPIHQYTGRHGETEHKVQALEALIDYQVTAGSMLVPYYVWLLDTVKYGIGVLGTYWNDDYEIISRLEEVPDTYNGVEIPGKTVLQRITEKIRTYSGSRAYNIRPHDFLPDPRVPIIRFQEGEFCGRRTDVGWNYILKRHAQKLYFNIDVLERMRDEATRREPSSARITLPEANSPTSALSTNVKDVGTVQLHEMCVELVPADWKLGSSKYPEKWMFTLANEKVIIGAQPLGLLHNKFPYDILEYEVEGYGLFKRSLLETIKPLNEVMTWLVNAHFYNVRKALNDQFILDPSRIVVKDVQDPNAGRIIRVKPGAYGQDVRTMITQLPVADVTGRHLTDSTVIEALMQRVSGVMDSVMGMPRRGGRQTATEVRTTTGFSINRLKTNAEYMSAVGFAPHSAKLVANTQQFYDQEQVFRIAGALPQGMNPFVQVTPETIAGAYDFVPVDGTLPVDKFALVSLWNELMKTMAQFPGLLAGYDVNGIFGYVAQLGGIKNLRQFQVQVQPDEMLQNAAQAGNVIPLGEAYAGRGTARAAGKGVSPSPVGGVAGLGLSS